MPKRRRKLWRVAAGQRTAGRRGRGRLRRWKKPAAVAVVVSVLLFVGREAAGSLIGKYVGPAVDLVTDTVRDLRGQPPLEVQVEDWTTEFALSQPIEQVGPPPPYGCTEEGYRQWAQRLAPAALTARVVVRVTTQTSKPTLYRGVEVHIRDRDPSERRTALGCAEGDAPGEGVHSVLLKLDRGRTDIQYLNDSGVPTPHKHGTAVLTRGKQETFEFIVGPATAHEYAWDFELLFSVDGQPYRYRVQDAGRAFRVAGLPADTRWYRGGPDTEGKWEQTGVGPSYIP